MILLQKQMQNGMWVRDKPVSEERKNRSKRLDSLEPKLNQDLGDLEESILRHHHGIGVKADAKLRTKAPNDQIYQQLLEMELQAFKKAGRLNELIDAADKVELKTENRKTEEIIRKMRRG